MDRFMKITGPATDTVSIRRVSDLHENHVRNRSTEISSASEQQKEIPFGRVEGKYSYARHICTPFQQGDRGKTYIKTFLYSSSLYCKPKKLTFASYMPE